MDKESSAAAPDKQAADILAGRLGVRLGRGISLAVPEQPKGSDNDNGGGNRAA